MSRYRVGNSVVEPETPEFDGAIERAYAARERPRCQCQPTGVAMYIAKVAGKYVLKRMPNSGETHAASCDHYEPPPELSGLGQVLGSAIEENVDDGITALKLGFSLSKGGSRPTPTPSATEADSVKSEGNKLTLRGTLHYLWEQAGFNRWVPGMADRRSWFVLRKYLLRAATDKRAKGQDLSEILYIPEQWRPDEKDAIAERRHVQFSKIAGASKVGRRLNLVIAEVKEIGPGRYGHRIVFKHAADAAFMLAEDIHKRMQKRFAAELGLWDSGQDVHLVLVGTFSVNATGVASIEELALMTVDLNWIPVESMADKMLVAKLIDRDRRFVKGLRYNLPSTTPLASAVLNDTEPKATALYIVPHGAEDEYAAATQTLIRDSALDSWVWQAGEQEMPPLPAAVHSPAPPAKSSREYQSDRSSLSQRRPAVAPASAKAAAQPPAAAPSVPVAPPPAASSVDDLLGVPWSQGQ